MDAVREEFHNSFFAPLEKFIAVQLADENDGHKSTFWLMDLDQSIEIDP